MLRTVRTAALIGACAGAAFFLTAGESRAAAATGYGSAATRAAACSNARYYAKLRTRGEVTDYGACDCSADGDGGFECNVTVYYRSRTQSAPAARTPGSSPPPRYTPPPPPVYRPPVYLPGVN